MDKIERLEKHLFKMLDEFKEEPPYDDWDHGWRAALYHVRNLISEFKDGVR